MTIANSDQQPVIVVTVGAWRCWRRGRVAMAVVVAVDEAVMMVAVAETIAAGAAAAAACKHVHA